MITVNIITADGLRCQLHEFPYARNGQVPRQFCRMFRTDPSFVPEEGFDTTTIQCFQRHYELIDYEDGVPLYRETYDRQPNSKYGDLIILDSLSRNNIEFKVLEGKAKWSLLLIQGSLKMFAQLNLDPEFNKPELMAIAQSKVRRHIVEMIFGRTRKIARELYRLLDEFAMENRVIDYKSFDNLSKRVKQLANAGEELEKE